MIAFDIDNTLANCTAGVTRALIKAGFEVSATREYDLALSVPEAAQGEARALITKLYRDPGFYAALMPYAGAADSLQWLARRNMVKLYATARPHHLATVTLEWLKLHGFPSANLVTNSSAAHRVDSMRACHAKILCDDNPGNALHASERGVGVVLIHHPYNLDLEHEGIIRTMSVNAFVKHLALIPVVDGRAKTNKY